MDYKDYSLIGLLLCEIILFITHYLYKVSAKKQIQALKELNDLQEKQLKEYESDWVIPKKQKLPIKGLHIKYIHLN